MLEQPRPCTATNKAGSAALTTGFCRLLEQPRPQQHGSSALTTGFCRLLGQPSTATNKLGRLPSQPVSAGCVVSLPQQQISWVGCPHTGFCRLLGQPSTATYKLGRLPSQPVSAGCLVSLHSNIKQYMVGGRNSRGETANQKTTYYIKVQIGNISTQ